MTERFAVLFSTTLLSTLLLAGGLGLSPAAAKDSPSGKSPVKGHAAKAAKTAASDKAARSSKATPSKKAASKAPSKTSIPLPPHKTVQKTHAAPPSATATTRQRSGSPLPPASEAAAIPLPRRRASAVGSKPPAVAARSAFHGSAVELPQAKPRFAAAPLPLRVAPPAPASSTAPPLALAQSATTSDSDLGTIKEAISLVRRGRDGEATALESGVRDPVAAKLIEWIILRSDSANGMSFDRYNSFVRANPSWPSVTTLRRRAEASLWDDNRDAATIRRFFGSNEPSLAKGHLALARALLQSGDRAGAQRQVREAWIGDDFSEALENATLQQFGNLLSRADHRARMHARFYANDTADALRAAHRLGGEDLAVAQARLAVMKNASNAKALLDAVPADARSDPGYIYSLCQWLRRHNHVAEAARLMHTVPHSAALLLNTDKWWQERRSLARELLDNGDARAAYIVVRDAVVPERDNYAVEQQFMAGWIALRFLRDPATAMTHFSRMTRGVENPISLARAGYWQGRAAEALGRTSEARAHYTTAARYSTAYYGQLARARLGEHIVLHRPPPLSAGQRATLNRLEVVRAIDMLYALNERGFVAIMAADLGDKADDASALSLIAEKAKAHGDARAMLLAGKLALARGLPMDVHAFPTAGLPRFRDIGPPIDLSVVYAIARQESGFNPNTVSRAKAMGYMQVTPSAGRYVAKKFGAPFDEKRLLSDPTYNMQMGAAELGDLLRDYHGSYILTFAGYNAGRGRVRTWIARYGDPRDPKVDPVDWVELIPFSETRNYVERVMENMQVYRALMGGGQHPLDEAELRAGSSVN